MLRFRTAELERDWQLLAANRRDSFIVSFGPEMDLKEAELAKYRGLMEERVRRWPAGTVLAFEGEACVGQLELLAREEEPFGYVNLIYLTPGYRGRGYAKVLHHYVETYFQSLNRTSMQLRVSVTNERAIRFYRKAGWRELYREESLGHEVIRMGRDLPPPLVEPASTVESIADAVRVKRQADVLADKVPGLELRSVRPNREGQNNDVLIVNEELVFRFPKYEDGIASLRRETALLRQVREKVSLSVPAPEWEQLGTERVGEAFAGHRLIPGVPLRAEWAEGLLPERRRELAVQLGTFLRELHGVPLEGLPVEPFSMDAWRGEWAGMYEKIRQHLFGSMRPGARDEVARAFDEFLGGEANFRFEPVLLHGDFGGSNLLVDEASGRMAGVIDFGQACAGDPAVDVANLIRYGEKFLHAMGTVYPELAEKIARGRFYRSTFALQEALFGVEHGDDAAIRRGLEGYV